ncbi:RNB-domain-containing protein [Setomelanomma holmii]|uniref:RNB-domain-containing protein n=1 Tax=Setomelanomma holmii TaxID=210430 RepID=A0A9P4H3U3_9PLEO|nr:RNB-domain-containing protein [Setomelanomma holmii]
MNNFPLLWTPNNICLRCQWRLRNQTSLFRQGFGRNRLRSVKASSPPRRALHATATPYQIALAPTNATPTFNPALLPRPPQLPLREHLQQWQQDYGGPTEEVLSAFGNHPANQDVHNGMSKLSSGSKADEDVESESWDNVDHDDGEELITIGHFLKPGDVVELSQAGREPVLAVFVQQIESDSQFFSVNGRWCHSNLTRVAFAIPGCIDPALLSPLVPFLPTDPGKANPKDDLQVPNNVAGPVLRILERMTIEAERIYHANAPVLDTAYAVLADPNRTRMMTLTQIAKTLLAQNDFAWKPFPAALLAVRKSLNHNEFRFRSDARSHRLTNVFAIRPKNDVQLVETVHEWIREHREYLASSAIRDSESTRPPPKGAVYIMDFLEKARRLIAVSRKDRECTLGTVGPSKARLSEIEQANGIKFFWGEPFTNSDKQIINFLQAWVLTQQFINMDGLHSACASLIMATGCYRKGTIQALGHDDSYLTEVQYSTGILFLQEIGVITPFENRFLYDEQLMLPTVRLSRNLELLNTKAELTRRNPDFRDSMAALRRDWGQTTVFCIDDEGANEIDDGLSIERIHGSSSDFWIHVHVANPTAFFDKTHTLSGLAAHMTETVYTPERSFPMLPSWATRGYFSLQPNRPVLTFSSRINASGHVLETKIQPGTIRKIVSITPSDVSSILGDNTSQNITRWVVGGEVAPSEGTKRPPKLSAEQLQDLQDMYAAARALWQARREAGGVRLGTFVNSVRVFESPGRPGITWNPPSTDRSRLVQGDPIIEVTQSVPKSLIHFGIGPKNIVEEMMLLACSTAASWCTERKIPVMYRGTIETPHAQKVSSEELKNLHILPYIEKHADVPFGLAMRYIESLGRAIAHSAPLPHKIIGVPGYVKVTSPLRRFSDMIAHWQIEAAIRYEAQSGKRYHADVMAPGARGTLPFTQRQMQESIVTLSPRERIISKTKQLSTRYWSILALLRAWQYKEAAMPDVFRFWVRSASRNELNTWGDGAQGLLVDYGFQATFFDTTEARPGDQWEVEIVKINLHLRRIHVRPIRLVHREEELV